MGDLVKLVRGERKLDDGGPVKKLGFLIFPQFCVPFAFPL